MVQKQKNLAKRLYDSGVMAFSARLNKGVTDRHVAIYRITGGLAGGRFGKFRILLLTTTGRKSGQARTSPLNYVPYGPNYAVAASNSGRDTVSAWFLNLQADPRATVQIGRRVIPVTAREATELERERLWRRFKQRGENYAEYEKLTDRRIPVMVLQPDKSTA